MEGRNTKIVQAVNHLWVIQLYTGIARRKAGSAEGIHVTHSKFPAKAGDSGLVAEEEADAPLLEQDNVAGLPEATPID
jgi:hypothetical protein